MLTSLLETGTGLDPKEMLNCSSPITIGGVGESPKSKLDGKGK